MRDFLFHTCGIFIFFILLSIMGYFCHADLVVFHNGDHRYGKATELPDENVSLDVDGAVKIYKKSQVKMVMYGVNSPAEGETVSATDFNQVGGARILTVTGPITHRKVVTTQAGKVMKLDVEDGFDVPVLHMFPTRYGFYNRRGCFVAGLLINPTTKTWKALQLRAHLFDGSEKILSSKDFYIFRIPGATDKGPGQRKFEMNFPDVDYARISRMRLVRKF